MKTFSVNDKMQKGIADIEDNINVLRLESIGEEDLARVAKYHRAWKKLQARR